MHANRIYTAFLTRFFLSICLTLPLLATAQDLFESAQNKSFENDILAPQDEFLLVTDAFKLTPSINKNTVILQWVIAPGYYLYQDRFIMSASNGLPLKPVFGQGTTKYDEFFEKDMVVFHDNATLTITIPADTPAFDLTVESQGCADAGLCYPPYKDYLRVNPNSQTITHIDAAEAGAETGMDDAVAANAIDAPWLLQIVVFALLGGIILNLMPCVFPVLSIKILSLVKADRERLALHGWAYTVGIVLCFLLFAGALLLARAGGEAIGWGFQLQSPLLIAALAYLFFIMGLSLSGLINIGTSWMGAGQSLTEKSGLTGSFFTGVLAAIVASPCTAPFMGAALGFALTQPAIVCLLIFAALGLGMAIPLLLLCYVPALANRLPRPGHWMETLKEFLAFPLYLTAVWLLWVLGRQAGIDVSMAVACGAVSIAFAFWLLGRKAHGGWLVFNRALVAIALICAPILLWRTLSHTEDSRWQVYSPEYLQELRTENKAVFVNLTADWCLTCLANERLTLHTEEVETAFDNNNVITLKGDWTNRDPHITELLKQYGRSGVPLYLWFPAGLEGKGEVLPQLLTKNRLIESLNRKIEQEVD